MVERVTGFSGMDIDGTVKKLMAAQRIPLDKLNQKKQVLEWQRDDYRTMNSKVLDLRNMAFNMKLQGPYMSRTASSDDEKVVTAKASTSAIPGNYSLKVKQVAMASTMTTDTVGAKPDGLPGTKLKGSATALEDLGMGKNESMIISGEKGAITIQVSKTDTISTMISNINAQASKTGVRASYDETMDKFFFTSTNTGSQAKIDLKFSNDINDPVNGATGLVDKVFKLSGTDANVATTTSSRTFTNGINTLINADLAAEQKLKISYNGKTSEIKVNKDSTVSQLITNINTSELGKLGVSAYLDESNHLVIVNPDTTTATPVVPPTDGKLTFTDSDGDGINVLLKSSLGLVDESVDPITPIAEKPKVYKSFVATAGLDAEVYFNGSSDITKYASNTFSINGIEFTAKKADIGNEVSVTVSQDTDSVYNSIKSLIDKYNETIGAFNDKISEEKFRSYTPLTDEQRESLTDDQIKQWEAKAKSGLLKNDFILSSSVSNFRLGLGGSVSGLSSGDLKQLSEIGIQTSADYSQKGKLIINEADLRKAIAENPEQVMNLFTAKDDSTKDSGHGIAVRIYDISTRFIDALKTKAGTSLSSSKDFDIGKSLDRINKQITSMNDRLTQMEDRYYKQFSAMESAMSKYSSQSSYFSSISGG
ncbi:flagellar filament capping protein FliD [Paenibacillus sp. LjRoot56]|uniref:flagellar filament capping protein FliD n=1 Tax=Paenibacillus sp. LjRoot56 TaxID=3342333 RepID=UPI003ECC8B17